MPRAPQVQPAYLLRQRKNQEVAEKPVKGRRNRPAPVPHRFTMETASEPSSGAAHGDRTDAAPMRHAVQVAPGMDAGLVVCSMFMHQLLLDSNDSAVQPEVFHRVRPNA